MAWRSAHSSKTPIIICIDVEPDERAVDPRKREDWSGFHETWKYFARLWPSLELATQAPARFGWFLRMDPQVSHTYGSGGWAVTRYRELFAEALLAQDEIGLHPHAWRWDDSEQKWISDFANQEWVERCVRQSFDEFENCFKSTCRSIRFGDRWINNQTVKLIERLGARFDLTIEPGRKPEKPPELFTGALPDYTPAPRRHYRPSKSDFLQPGSFLSRRNLWMLPVNTASLDWVISPAQTTPPESPPTRSPDDVNYEYLVYEQNASYLALVLRTEAILHREHLTYMERNFEHIMSHPLANNFVITTPAEAIGILQGKRRSNFRNRGMVCEDVENNA